MNRLAIFIAPLLFAIACGETTPPLVTQLNLDRPMDITFGCFGNMRVTDGRTTGSIDDPIVLTAQPPAACEFRSEPGQPVPPGQEDLTDIGGTPVGGSAWIGFILQAGRGTVAITRFGTTPSASFSDDLLGILDTDPLTPNTNSISIAEDPVAIATDRTGCKVITANAGSCDLSVLDVNAAVDFDPTTPIDVQRVDVKNAAGEVIRARPAAMMAEPSIEEFGKTCPATADGLAYIAYPSCHLVAAVDLATATIVGGVQFDANGVATIVDGNVSCPDECGGGGTITAGSRPVAIDIERDARTGEKRLVIGADNEAAIYVVELNDTTYLPESVQPFPLEGDVGVRQLALSPTIGMGGALGFINDDIAVGGDFQFVYAIATDDTIRVVDVLTTLRECDTQIDPRYLRGIRSVRELSCLQIGDADTPGLIRREGVKGPGIELIGDGVPLSLDIYKSVELGEGGGESPGVFVGYYAAVSATNGLTFMITIDDDAQRDLFEASVPLATPMPLLLPHQIRDTVSNRARRAEVDVDQTTETEDIRPTCDPNFPGAEPGLLVGGPRTTAAPTRIASINSVAAEKVTQLPIFRQLRCEGVELNPPFEPVVRAVSELSFPAPEAVRDLVYPDLAVLRSEETWTLTWEGNLSVDRFETDVDGPPIRESEIFVDQAAGMRIVDQTRPFCDAGVEEFDIVQLRGCDPAFGNADCPIGHRCFVHPASQIAGLGACMLDDEADRLADACRDFLTSQRRYTIATTQSGTLGLLPRRHTLRTTPVEGCVSNEQCEALGDYASTLASPLHPVDSDITDARTWTCEVDPNRRPMAPGATGKRCQLRCDSTADCVAGTVCRGGTPDAGTKAGFCMESVVPPQACVNSTQRYELRAGDAFAVVGERSGFEHSIVADANGNCVRDPATEPPLAPGLRAGRIPLDPPPCDPTADPLTGRLPNGDFDDNPCSTTVTHTELQLNYVPGTCTFAEPATDVREREAPAIRYRNRGMTMTLVDPTYPGDQTCILDRLGAPNVGTANIPLVFPGYQIGFRQTGGFGAQVLPITPSFPVKVVRGPSNSIWIVDEGDFLSTSIGQSSTRGRVFRVEPSLSNISIAQ